MYDNIESPLILNSCLSKDSECSRGNSPNTGGKSENDKNKDRHFYNSHQIHSYSGRKAFKAATHGMTINRFCLLPVYITKLLQQISMRLLHEYITYDGIFRIWRLLFCRCFSVAANHQQSFKSSYHRINNNIVGQNKTKHTLHSNGNNNNNNNNNTSHSPSSVGPEIVYGDETCTIILDITSVT